MNARIFGRIGLALGLLGALCILTLTAEAQPGRRGRGPRGGGPPAAAPVAGVEGDAAFARDRELFHFLLDHRSEIRRQIKMLDNGVETLTESDNPQVTAAIQEHVASMEKRVREKRPIHLRDPLFAAVFGKAASIRFQAEQTPHGMKVIETSDDAFAAKLVQAHAQVVSLFIQHGFPEVRRNHEVPAAQ